jgi:hypothetical protein
MEIDSMATRRNGLTSIFTKNIEIIMGSNDTDFPVRNRHIAAAELSKYDAIWDSALIKMYDVNLWNTLRSDYPNTLCLFYIGSDSTHVSSASDAYFDYNYINEQHPEWFILRDAVTPASSDPAITSNRMMWAAGDDIGDPNSDYYRYYLDICNPEFQDWAAEELLRLVQIPDDRFKPYDGIALDNVNIGYYRTHILTNAYPLWTYAGLEDTWNNGFIEYLRKIKVKLNKNGLKVAGNWNLWYHTGIDGESLWNKAIQSMDILATERQLINESSDIIHSGTLWENCLAREDIINNTNKPHWWIVYPDTGANQQKQFMYFYCSWLMVKSDNSLFWAAENVEGVDSPEKPWYPEYEYDLGYPLGARYEISSLWLREYTNAWVAVNPTEASHNVFATGTCFVPTSLTTTNTNVDYTVPSMSGIIIIKDN